MSRRFLVPLTGALLVTLLVLPAPVRADEGDMARTPEDVVEMILSGDEQERARAAAILEVAPPAWIEAFVEALRGRLGGTPPEAATAHPVAKASRILLSADIWTMPRAFMQTAFEGSGGQTIHFLDDLDRQVITQGLVKREGAALRTGPRVVVRDGRKGLLSLVEQVHYVREHTLLRAPAAALAEPVIGRLDEGVVLEITPTRSEDGRHTTLEMHIRTLSVARPIPEESVRLEGIEEPVVVERPVHDSIESRVTLRIPDGGSVALTGTADPANPDLECVVVVQATVLPEEPARPVAQRTDDAEPPLIRVEATLIEAPGAHVLQALGTSFPPGHQAVLRIKASQAGKLLGAGQPAGAGATVLHAPTLLARAGESAAVNSLDWFSYLSDFDAEAEVGSPTPRSPLGQTISEGFVFEVEPSITDDKTALRLLTKCNFARILRPVPAHHKTFEGRDVTVHVPELHVCRRTEDVRMLPGGHAAFLLDRDEDGTHRILLLHATLVTEPSNAAGASDSR